MNDVIDIVKAPTGVPHNSSLQSYTYNLYYNRLPCYGFGPAQLPHDVCGPSLHYYPHRRRNTLHVGQRFFGWPYSRV